MKSSTRLREREREREERAREADARVAARVSYFDPDSVLNAVPLSILFTNYPGKLLAEKLISFPPGAPQSPVDEETCVLHESHWQCVQR